jgi:hypothetical protein
MKNDFCDMTSEEKAAYYEMLARVENNAGHENTAKELFQKADELRGKNDLLMLCVQTTHGAG